MLATAVLDLWPGTKVSIGPPIESGYYYDFEFPDGFRPSEADLERIEERMAAHIEADERLRAHRDAGRRGARALPRRGQPYKVELIEDLVRDQGVETVSLYRNGPFMDLCRGPHGPSTGRIKAFKLNSVAGAYWRGDETRQMLTRIYGTAFFSKQELEEHLERLEQARARDHRRLGPQLGLFSSQRGAGHAVLAAQRDGAAAADRGRGARAARSARLLGDQDAAGARRGALAPLGPLGQLPREHVLHRGRSERRVRAEADELPRRLPGLRVRAALLPRPAAPPGRVRPASPATSARACCTGCCGCARSPRTTPTSTARRSRSPTRWTRSARRSTSSTRASASTTCGSSSRPGPRSRSAPTSSGSGPRRALREALERQGREYEVSPGEGTFYGPKIDFHVTDALGRSWQCGTCQLDFQMPERFDLTYQGADNAEHRPVMIHRALLGSMERFVGILIEHYGGRFPVWLAPVQVVVLPVADRHVAYAREVAAELREAGVRVQVDERSESVGKKVHDAEAAKLPYMLVLGDREQQAGAVSVRSHERGGPGSDDRRRARGPGECGGRAVPTQPRVRPLK